MKSQLANRDRLIIALDVATNARALDLLAQLSGVVSFFKVGLQVYTALGPEIIAAVKATGANIFLDLKLYDIPNTVARAVEMAGNLGVQMLSIHLSGGREMIEAAVSAKSSAMTLLGVTVLTSADTKTLREIGVDSPVEEHVLRLAALGAAAQIDGFVASPQELKALRARFGEKVKLVIPGVRPAWSEPGDQKRFMTPRDALRNGADYLVIGRPITSHPEPLEAVEKILSELAGVAQIAALQ
jgi:orotidine-5'-phosphate decarboxylase